MFDKATSLVGDVLNSDRVKAKKSATEKTNQNFVLKETEHE